MAALPRYVDANIMIFRAWKGGQWREVERIKVDPNNPFHIERKAKRYEELEQAEFYDKNMHNITTADCFRAAQEEGTNSIFMIYHDGPFERTITRAIVTEADKVSAPIRPLQAAGQKRAR
jgi:hypothetical protein